MEAICIHRVWTISRPLLSRIQCHRRTRYCRLTCKTWLRTRLSGTCSKDTLAGSFCVGSITGLWPSVRMECMRLTSCSLTKAGTRLSACCLRRTLKRRRNCLQLENITFLRADK